MRKAVRKGEIRPPDDGSDDFDTSDAQYGPSIYTVAAPTLGLGFRVQGLGFGVQGLGFRV